MKPRVYKATGFNRWMTRIMYEAGPAYSMWTNWGDAIERALNPKELRVFQRPQRLNASDQS